MPGVVMLADAVGESLHAEGATEEHIVHCTYGEFVKRFEHMDDTDVLRYIDAVFNGDVATLKQCRQAQHTKGRVVGLLEKLFRPQTKLDVVTGCAKLCFSDSPEQLGLTFLQDDHRMEIRLLLAGVQEDYLLRKPNVEISTNVLSVHACVDHSVSGIGAIPPPSATHPLYVTVFEIEKSTKQILRIQRMESFLNKLCKDVWKLRSSFMLLCMNEDRPALYLPSILIRNYDVDPPTQNALDEWTNTVATAVTQHLGNNVSHVGDRLIKLEDSKDLLWWISWDSDLHRKGKDCILRWWKKYAKGDETIENVLLNTCIRTERTGKQNLPRKPRGHLVWSEQSSQRFPVDIERPDGVEESGSVPGIPCTTQIRCYCCELERREGREISGNYVWIPPQNAPILVMALSTQRELLEESGLCFECVRASEAGLFVYGIYQFDEDLLLSLAAKGCFIHSNGDCSNSSLKLQKFTVEKQRNMLYKSGSEYPPPGGPRSSLAQDVRNLCESEYSGKLVVVDELGHHVTKTRCVTVTAIASESDSFVSGLHDHMKDIFHVSKLSPVVPFQCHFVQRLLCVPTNDGVCKHCGNSLLEWRWIDGPRAVDKREWIEVIVLSLFNSSVTQVVEERVRAMRGTATPDDIWAIAMNVLRRRMNAERSALGAVDFLRSIGFNGSSFLASTLFQMAEDIGTCSERCVSLLRTVERFIASLRSTVLGFSGPLLGDTIAKQLSECCEEVNGRTVTVRTHSWNSPPLESDSPDKLLLKLGFSRDRLEDNDEDVILYHGTTIEHATSIACSGLDPSKLSEYCDFGKAFYCTPSWEYALYAASRTRKLFRSQSKQCHHLDPAVLEFRVNKEWLGLLNVLPLGDGHELWKKIVSGCLTRSLRTALDKDAHKRFMSAQVVLGAICKNADRVDLGRGNPMADDYGQYAFRFDEHLYDEDGITHFSNEMQKKTAKNVRLCCVHRVIN